MHARKEKDLGIWDQRGRLCRHRCRTLRGAYLGFQRLADPGAGNVGIRPAIVIPMFFGIAFGPIVGFITGFVGNILADMLSGYGFWIWWDLGNGIIGLIPGLFSAMIYKYNETKSIILGEASVVLGSAVGMAVSSLSELWVSGADMKTVIFGNFVPAFLTNIVWGLVLLPVLMIAYAAILKRTGR